VGAALGSAVIFGLYAFVLPVAVMAVALYLVRIVPLAGRPRKRTSAATAAAPPTHPPTRGQPGEPGPQEHS